MLISIGKQVPPLLLLLQQLAPTATAWGKYGHEIVGNIAYHRLSPKAQDAVKSILGVTHTAPSKPDPLYDETPLAAVANWADKVRFTSEYHWSYQLHFVDVRDDEIDGGCPCTSSAPPNNGVFDEGEGKYCVMRSASSCWFDYERDCQRDFCAVGAITNYTRRLQEYHQPSSINMLRGGSKDNNAQPLHDGGEWYAKEALMFLTHFVGDIHQPLHSSRGSDRGGNSIHVGFKGYHGLYRGRKGPAVPKKKEQWNLHSVWDDGIIERAFVQLYNSSEIAFEASVFQLVAEAESTGLIDNWLRCSDGLAVECPSSWAEESLDDALRWAYSDEFGLEITDGAILSDSYFDTRLHVVTRRLAAAGVRLAAVLEAVLGGNDDLKSTRTGELVNLLVGMQKPFLMLSS